MYYSYYPSNVVTYKRILLLLVMPYRVYIVVSMYADIVHSTAWFSSNVYVGGLTGTIGSM
jgi:hypothetical protein